MLTCHAVYGDLALTVPFPGLEARHGAEVLMDLVAHPWDYDVLVGHRAELPALVRVEFALADRGTWLAFDGASRLVAGALPTFDRDGTVDPAVWFEGDPAGAGHPRHRATRDGWLQMRRAADGDGTVEDGTGWDFPHRPADG